MSAVGTAVACVTVVALIQVSAYFQVKTTMRAIQARTTTRHANPTPRPRPRPQTAAPTEEYPGRTPRPYVAHLGTQTAGAPPIPPTAGAPAPHTARHVGVWTDPSWPPTTGDDDDTRQMNAVT